MLKMSPYGASRTYSISDSVALSIFAMLFYAILAVASVAYQMALASVGLEVSSGPVRRSGAGHDKLVGMVFAFFLFLIFFVYLLIPELISLATTVLTALSTGEQAIIGVVGIVVVAMLIYGLYRHGSR